MFPHGTPFTHPQTPAAKCLHLIRLNPVITRAELIEQTGLSQPTITRAVAALIEAGLVAERPDLTHAKGRGRPTVPVELAQTGWAHAGIAVGTTTTVIGIYDTSGRALRTAETSIPIATMTELDFSEHLAAALNRITTGLNRRLVSVGVTTSGTVDSSGVVTAPNLGWDNADIASRLRYHFSVPVVVASAIPAIVGSETQAAKNIQPAPTLTLFADDSVGAALSDVHSVRQISPLPAATPGSTRPEIALTTSATLKLLDAHGHAASSLAEAIKTAESNPEVRAILDDRARLLGQLCIALVQQHSPETVVIAGSAFAEDSRAPKIFSSTVRKAAHDAGVPAPHLRMIPNHSEIVRAITRATALDLVLRLPLELAKSLR